MPIDSVESLIRVLTQHRLLQPAALEELNRSLASRFREPRSLAKELLNRGWLTPYQLNQIMQGRGAELVLGSYLILERLSEGPVGELFKARHQHMKREAAVQIVRAELLQQPGAVERFYQEVQQASQVTHVNLVAAYDAGPIGPTHFLAMEYVDGIDLERLVRQSGPLPVGTACAYLVQAARGLQHAADRGVWHHDLKPANILVSRPEGGQGQVKIRNLGLTLIRLHTRHTRLQTGTSADGAAAADYLAPEQERPGEVKDVRSLLYNLGCTAYFLMSGDVPFPGGSLAEKIARHRTEAPPPLEQRRGDLPAEVSDIVDRLLAKDPADRYPGFAELMADLAGLRSLGGSGSRSAVRRQVQHQETQRHWRLVVGLGSGALVLGIAFILFLVSRGKSTPTVERGLDGKATVLAKLPKLAPVLIVQCGKGAGKQQDELVTPGYGYQLVQGEPFDGWDPASHRKHCWFHGQLLRFTVTVPPQTGGTLRLLFVDADTQQRKQKLTVQGKEIGSYENFFGIGTTVDVPIQASDVRNGVIEVAVENLNKGINAVISTVEFLADTSAKRR